ncbi:helix-turn-helix transcriptional regulator [Streptomyces sparsogenes]|uniref:DeoR family transcriptional regulator n=1 Tax=Streptomyces sparsogenes DSM 40356 TaxID=1331668 RepID=A0A1R1SCX6_9ACTN|nr:WYL domain-containing protein [Streptomyces sparsogenes]OMI36135.1 DeoR family transcriptional regulator [Streptomyces sparsogenes DSM 40356]
MKSDRLLSILLLLQTHGQVPASELARRLEVSVRTIFRDVEALSAAGVPVYTERGRNGGIRLLPGYRTDVSGLTADEARALFVLVTEQAHADLGLGRAIGSALRKVMAAVPAPFRGDADLASRRILIDPVRWRGTPRPSAVDLGVLQAAVFNDRRLRLRYRHGRDRQVRSYTLDPYGLVSKAGAWYLVADHRGRPMMFRSDRMLSASVVEEPVRRRGGVELADVWEALREGIDRIPASVRVVVRVRRSALARFLRYHEANLAVPAPALEDAEAGAGDDGGPVELELGFPALGAAEQLLAFGPAVEVVEPAELREALVRRARETISLYAPPDDAVR